MTSSNTVYSFKAFERDGNILLEAQEYPWCILQVVPTTPEDYERTREILMKRGYVAEHDHRRDFFIIHVASGDHDGNHPERFVRVTQENHLDVANALKDAMVQGAVWYATNIDPNKTYQL